MTSPRQWWRRAAAAVKDKQSLCLARVAGPARDAEMEAAVIRATSHDERAVDYASAARVFAWARASPSFMRPLMRAVSRRAGRTRCWAVALKALMLAHGLLLRSDTAPPRARLGRLPFDLSDFRDRSAYPPAMSPPFSAFVRAYFAFLDHRSLFAALLDQPNPNPNPNPNPGLHDEDDDDDDDDDDTLLDRIQKLQILLDLLMQIRPYADGMEVGLVLEAMDCVAVEIFEVYSEICDGIARFLVGILSSSSDHPPQGPGEVEEARWRGRRRRRRGLIGIRIVRKATAQSSLLSSYFDLCRSLGVLNATDFPAVETIPEEDIRDLERLVVEGCAPSPEKAIVVVGSGSSSGSGSGSGSGLCGGGGGRGEGKGIDMEEEERGSDGGVARSRRTVVTKEWVVFEEEDAAEMQGHFGKSVVTGQGHSGNPFICSPENSWASMVGPTAGAPFRSNGNLIELI